MYNKWEKYHEYDSKNPTFSSTLLDKINKSLKTNPKNDFEDDATFFRPSKGGKKTEEAKMSTLRRANLVEKLIDKKVSEKVTKKSKVINTSLVEEFDVQDTLFFSTTSTSSSSSEAEYFENTHPKLTQQKQPRVTCFPPPQMPKPVRTLPKPTQVESKFIQKDVELLKSRSRAVKIYSNLKNNLNKQPISPGVRLTGFINSLFNKENKSTKKNNNVAKLEKIKASYSTCTTPTTSYSRSCFNNKEKKVFQDDNHNGINKRTVKFCPVSVIVDENSRPCGEKSLFVEGEGYDRNLTSKFARTLSKRYEELRVLNGLERKNEEVALDLLSGYCWDSRLSRVNCNVVSKDKVNECDYGDEDDDGLSCSSSDLFELEHLSLIGDELPVYETTRFNSRLN